MHRGFEVGNSCELEIIDKAITELRMYFNGELTEFSVETGFYGTDFEKRCGNNCLKYRMAQP